MEERKNQKPIESKYYVYTVLITIFVIAFIILFQYFMLFFLLGCFVIGCLMVMLLPSILFSYDKNGKI